MLIRKCREDEIISVGAFYDDVVLWLDNHVNYPKWLYKTYPSESFVRDMTATQAQYLCFDGPKLVAAFVLNDDPQGDYQKGAWSRALPDGAYMVLHALAIAPERQGEGLGSEIVRFCVERAKSLDYQAIRVDIVPGNWPAKKLYEKNGFDYVGDFDLGRGYEHIPVFSLFELNW